MNFFQQATNFFSNMLSNVTSFVRDMFNRINTDAVSSTLQSAVQTTSDTAAYALQTAASYLPSRTTAAQNKQEAPRFDINSTLGTTCDDSGNRRSARLKNK